MTQHANHHTTQHEPAQHNARFSVADSRRDGYAQPQSSRALRSVAPVGSDPRGFFVLGPRRRTCRAVLGSQSQRGEPRVPPTRYELQGNPTDAGRYCVRWRQARRCQADCELGQCDEIAAYEGSGVIERTVNKGAP